MLAPALISDAISWIIVSAMFALSKRVWYNGGKEGAEAPASLLFNQLDQRCYECYQSADQVDHRRD